MASDRKFSTQDDLDVVWIQVVEEFEKETGSRLQPANGAVLSVSDVIDGIDPHKHVPESTKNKAIRVTQSILSSVQLFGGFVASAASGVFGPSQQCFNALNHVITTTQKYSQVFEDLTTLLERVSAFLETLSNYLNGEDAEVKLDKRLRPNVYRVLEHFLVTLTLTHRLAKRREKAKLFGRLLIAGDDGGVTAALATLETRVVDVTRVQITTIGKDLSVAARGLRSMQGDIDAILKYDEENSITLKSLAATESSRASAEAIRNWLNLEETQSWRHRHARLTEECLPGTGSWLFTNDNFVQWKDPSSTKTKVVLITGKANRGKSCLTSAVIDHLRDSMERTGGAAHPLAYHYLQNTANQGPGPSSINLALRSIIWQLGQLDRGYYAFLSKAYADGANLQDAVSVWRKLLAGYMPDNRTTFFVVLDGLGGSIAETVRFIVGEATRQCEASTQEESNHEASTPSHLQIRLFLSGSPEAASWLENPTKIHKIALDPDFDGKKVANTNDVQELIRKRLGSMPIFNQEMTPFKKQQQQEIMHALTVHIQNDFAALDLVFEELERCTNLHQLKKALERVDENMEVRFGRHIDSLNQSLSKHEILELNAIMVCIGTSSNRNHEGDPWGSPIELVQEYVDFSLRTTRLVPLKQQIEHTYHSIFLITAEGLVCWRHKELERYLKERSRDERTMRSVLAKRIKSSDLLDPEELNLLEKVVQTNFMHVFGAYGIELFDKYGFAEFFASKREPYNVRISFGRRDSELAALLVSLQIICEDPDVHRCHELRVHALDNLFRHLQWADEWGNYRKKSRWEATKQEQIAIGKFVVKILRNDSVIDAYARDGPGSIGYGFSRRHAHLDTKDQFRNWLKGLEPDDLDDREEKEWLRTWKSGTGSCWDYVSNRLIRRWLKIGHEGWSGARCFVAGRTMDEKHSLLCIKFADDDPETLQRITKLMIEACENDPRGAISEWNREWIVSWCDNILEVSDKTWWALFFAAKYELPDSISWELSDINMNVIQKAHDYLKDVLDLELIEEEDYTKRYWQEMLPLFARCQIYLRNLAGAKATYIRMMGSNQSWEVMNLRLFSVFEPCMIMELLEASQSALEVEPSGHNLLHQMLSGNHEAEDMLTLRLAAHSGCNWHSIINLIEHSALIGPSFKDSWSTMAHILWHKSGGDTQREDRALDIWKQWGETQAIVDALLGRARIERPGNPLESDAFQRLKRMHPEISDPTDDCDNISSRAKLMIAGWQHQSGQETEARQFISALLGHRVYSGSTGSAERRAVLADWGFACIAVGNEVLGVLLLEQIPLTDRYDPERHDHVGCREICSQTDVTGQSNAEPELLCCKTCLAVIAPKCRATVEKGIWVPDLCEPNHQYLSMRRLQRPPYGKEEVNYGVTLYRDWGVEGCVYTTWSEENDGFERARELYGWTNPAVF